MTISGTAADQLVKGLGQLQKWLLAVHQQGHVVTTQDTIVLTDEEVARRICLGMVDQKMFLGVQEGEAAWISSLCWSHLSCMKSEAAIFLVSEEASSAGHVVPPFAIGFKTNHPARLMLLQRVRSIDIRLVVLEGDGSVSGVAKEVMHSLPVVLADASARGNGGYRLILEPPPVRLSPSGARI